MRSLDELLDEVRIVLQFPDYFGRNWDALKECLADLSWLPGPAYVLLVRDSVDVLADEPPHQFAIFLKVLDRVGAEWAKPIELGESWDRPAIPFHVIFHEVPERREELQAQFERARLDIEPLESRD